LVESGPPPPPGSEELQALADKYCQLAEMRARRDDRQPGTAETPRAVLRSLAERHPGCLRELDTLGGAELERRARAAAAAAQGGPREPWMAWICAYHRMMRAALVVKRAVGRGAPPAGEAGLRLLAAAHASTDLRLDEQFLADVARPPQGRIGVLVLRRLGLLFDAPAAELARTLFPPRRSSPYTLG
jgi:hypothetical protein